ncbi:MAG: sulfatase-like hydrolase/transferase, partial [Myxococcales bacterium]|nr:sulfatase-like hydrolase/transferase [Myxococcales bacterium]
VATDWESLGALGAGANKGAFLVLQQSVFLALAILYASIVGSLLGSLHSFVGLDDGVRRAWRKLREKKFDVRFTSTMFAIGVAMLGFFITFRLMLRTKDPDFFEKPISGSYFAVISVLLTTIWALVSLSAYRLARAVLRPIRERIGFSISAVLLGLGLLGALFVFALVTVKARGDENLRNVIRLPLLFAATAGIHTVALAALFALRRSRLLQALVSVPGRYPLYLVALGIVGYGALRTDAHPEAKAAMASKSLYELEAVRFFQAIVDLDGDGSSFIYGGPDCNDFNAKIGPHADDIPGNGIDEDCRGGDRQPDPPERKRIAESKTPDPRPTKSPNGKLKTDGVSKTDGTSKNGNHRTTNGTPNNANTLVHAPQPDLRNPTAPQPNNPTAPRPMTAQNHKRPVGLTKPNIIFILIDTVRADHVGFYGYSRKTTPELDKLALRSIVFKNTYSPSNNTPKSTPAIFISRFPSEIKWNKKFRNFPKVLDENLMFPEVLKRAGYYNVALTAHWYFNPRKRNFNQGFDVWDNAGEKTIKDSNTQISGPTITKKVTEWLPKLAKSQKPFFLFVHYFDPHSRYMVHKSLPQWGKALIDKYDNEILFTDRHLGGVIAQIEKLGLSKNSVVIVTSDHGEGFGEHKFYFHGQTLYNEALKVPLILHIPGRSHSVVERDVSLVDLYPTILALAGVDPVAGLRGRSLLPLIENPKAPWDYPIFAELVRYPNWKEDIKTMIHKRLKVIYHMTRNTWELYDLDNDPGEKKNLFFTHPKAKAYKARLLHFMDHELGR